MSLLKLTQRTIAASALAFGVAAGAGAALAEDGERIMGDPAYGLVQIAAMPSAIETAAVGPVSSDWQGTPPSHHGQ